MNDENLRPLQKDDELSDDAKNKQREIRRKGAYASHEARKKKTELKKILEVALPMKEQNAQIREMMRQNGWADKDITQAVVAVQGLLMKAKQGDVAAFNAIRDLNGEKPVDEVQSNVLNTNIDIGFVETGKKLAGDEDEIED